MCQHFWDSLHMISLSLLTGCLLTSVVKINSQIRVIIHIDFSRLIIDDSECVVIRSDYM